MPLTLARWVEYLWRYVRNETAWGPNSSDGRYRAYQLLAELRTAYRGAG